MNLKKLFYAFTLTLVWGFASKGQEYKCPAKLADLPSIQELRGFSVGMTLEQVKARLPKLKLRPADQMGFTSLNIFPEYEVGIDKAAFAGLRTISLDILDNRVFSVWIGYDKTFKWQTLDEFVQGMNAALKLPNTWRSKLRTRLLDCADFTVTVSPVGESPSIKITDRTAKEILDKRQAAREEAQP
jgi:hypothetical protein